jgi:sugar phosphate isomerase/epimerase
MYRTLSPGAINVSVSFEEGARLAARHGFEGLALDAGHLLELGADAIRDTLTEHGLRPGSFGLPVDIRGDNDAYEASLTHLEAVATAAQQVGCSRASTYIFSWSDDKDYQANFEFHRERLARPAAILAEHGIALGFEFLGPKTLRDGQPYTFIHTAKGMLELCDAVGLNVGLLLDAWHWYTAGNDKADLDLLTASNVVDVHVNDAPAGISIDEQVDSVRCLPGETGVINLNGFLGALQRVGYEGPVVVEPFNSRLNAMPAEDAVRTTAEALYKVWREAGLVRV